MDPGQKLYIDTERVIQAVRARRNIWNPADENYKNKRQRAYAWTAVCHDVLDHFERYPDEDRKELEKRVQQRWRTARDSYVKARTRPSAAAAAAAGAAGAPGAPGAPGSQDTQYVFMDQLFFLEPTLRHPRPLPSERNQSLADNVEGVKSRTKRVKHGRSMLSAEREREREGVGESTGRMSSCERALVRLLQRTASPLRDDDESFFRSLAPTLATLDAHHKLLFRSRVLATALDVQAQCNSVFLEAPLVNLQEDEPLEQKYRPPSPGAGALGSPDADDAAAAGTDSSSDNHSSTETPAQNITVPILTLIK